jgi:hypothetical protein
MAKGDRWSNDPDVKVREMRNAETVLGVISERGRRSVCQKCHEAIHRERPKRHPILKSTTGEPLEIERLTSGSEGGG